MKRIFMVLISTVLLINTTFAQVEQIVSEEENKGLSIDTTYTISCNETVITGTDASALGYRSEAYGNYSTAIGYLSNASGTCSFAAGYRSEATMTGAFALGYTAQALGVASFAAGKGAKSEGTASFSLGFYTNASSDYSMVFGKYLKGIATNAFIIGSGANEDSYLENNQANSLMIGFGSTVPTFYVGPGTHTNFGRVGIGTTAPATTLDVNGTLRISGNSTFGTPEENNKMYVNGEIYTNELIVNAESWPDFVFAPEYKLKKLEEVEEFIAQNGHLPDVPNQAEVLENGQKVAAMNAILLQKIEELTLYMIELKKENEKLQYENTEIKHRLEVLEK